MGKSFREYDHEEHEHRLINRREARKEKLRVKESSFSPNSPPSQLNEGIKRDWEKR